MQVGNVIDMNPLDQYYLHPGGNCKSSAHLSTVWFNSQVSGNLGETPPPAVLVAVWNETNCVIILDLLNKEDDAQREDIDTGN